MQQPLVTIIIPAYNRADLIGETLDSVLAQNYFNWECIVVDDGSTDETNKVVESYIQKDKRFKLLFRPATRKKGPSSCRNIGIENATGEFVLFLDSDDLLSIDCIQKRIKFYIENSNFDFYIFKTQIFKNKPNDFDQIHNIKLDDYADKKYLDLFFKGKTPFSIMSPIWKTEVLKKINGFDENLTMLEDPELHLRAFLKGYVSKTNLSDKPDSFYRQSFNLRKDESLKNYFNKANQYYYFISKYIKLKNKSFEYFALKFYKNYVINTKFFSFKTILKYFILFYKNKVFNNKMIVLIIPLTFIVFFNSKLSLFDSKRMKEFVFK